MFHKRKTYCISNANVNTVSQEQIFPDDTSSVLDHPPTNSEKKRNLLKPFLGFFYVLMTSVFITLTSVFVKQLTYISPGQLSLVRNAGVFVGCLPIACYSVSDMFGAKKDRIMLVVRGFLAATALYLNLTAFRYLPLAEAAVIMSALPAMVSIFARLYLKEACGVIQSICIFATLCGVLLSIRLPTLLHQRSSVYLNPQYIGGLGSAVGCVLILSVSFVALRKMKDIHFSVSLIYIGFIGAVENAVINFFVAEYELPRCGLDTLLVALIGFFGFIGHCTLTLAIQVEAVGVVSVMKASMDIVVAMVLQIIFFHVKPDVYTISGACVVITSVSIIGLRKWLLTLPDDSHTRKKLKYLLL